MNIVWKRPDGSIAVTHLAGNKAVFDKLSKTKQDGVIKKEADKLKANGSIPKNWKKVATNAPIPEDRLFRDAWAWPTAAEKIGVDVDKAKELTHVKRRVKREGAFAPLDKQINVNIADQAAVASIEADRLIIRKKYDDMQVAIDMCSNEDSLRSLISKEGI